jgi:hypothetical protein
MIENPPRGGTDVTRSLTTCTAGLVAWLMWTIVGSANAVASPYPCSYYQRQISDARQNLREGCKYGLTKQQQRYCISEIQRAIRGWQAELRTCSNASKRSPRRKESADAARHVGALIDSAARGLEEQERQLERANDETLEGWDKRLANREAQAAEAEERLRQLRRDLADTFEQLHAFDDIERPVCTELSGYTQPQHCAKQHTGCAPIQPSMTESEYLEYAWDLLTPAACRDFDDGNRKFAATALAEHEAEIAQRNAGQSSPGHPCCNRHDSWLAEGVHVLRALQRAIIEQYGDNFDFVRQAPQECASHLMQAFLDVGHAGTQWEFRLKIMMSKDGPYDIAFAWRPSMSVDNGALRHACDELALFDECLSKSTRRP